MRATRPLNFLFYPCIQDDCSISTYLNPGGIPLRYLKNHFDLIHRGYGQQAARLPAGRILDEVALVYPAIGDDTIERSMNLAVVREDAARCTSSLAT